MTMVPNHSATSLPIKVNILNFRFRGWGVLGMILGFRSKGLRVQGITKFRDERACCSSMGGFELVSGDLTRDPNLL